MSGPTFPTPHPAIPNLTADNHRVTSPATVDYNCIAWAAHDMTRWWEPGVGYWPAAVAGDGSWFGDLVRAYEAVGWAACEAGVLEPGYEKVALYAASTMIWTHAARQLPTGRWTSKLGRSEDVEHDTPDDVAGGVYGRVHQFMSRSLDG